jgi:hypothetical protein
MTETRKRKLDAEQPHAGPVCKKRKTALTFIDLTVDITTEPICPYADPQYLCVALKISHSGYIKCALSVNSESVSCLLYIDPALPKNKARKYLDDVYLGTTELVQKRGYSFLHLLSENCEYPNNLDPTGKPHSDFQQFTFAIQQYNENDSTSQWRLRLSS